MKTSQLPSVGTPAFVACAVVVHRRGLPATALMLAAGLLALASLPQARASDPVGIYAFVDKVVLAPDDKRPQTIEVWGGFALADGRGQNYATAIRGWMHFKLNSEKPELCLREWKDLQSVAGTGQLVAFGSRYEPIGTVRKPDAGKSSPDTYPLGFGVQKVRSDQRYVPIQQLVELRDSKPATPTPKGQ